MSFKYLWAKRSWFPAVELALCGWQSTSSGPAGRGRKTGTVTRISCEFSTTFWECYQWSCRWFLLPVSLKDGNGRKNLTCGLAAFFSEAQDFFATLRWFWTIIHGQLKGSFSTAKFLFPTDGSWDPGLPLSQNEELMAGQIPKGAEAQLAPSHTEELTCQQDLQRHVNLWTEGSFIAICQETFPPLCVTWITASVAALAKFGILSN